MEYGVVTHKGMCKEHNEDSCLALPKRRIFAVADGVGGNKSGEIASCKALEALVEYLDESDIENVLNEDMENYFDNCSTYINDKILNISIREDRCRGMATTLVFAYFRGKVAHFCNIGDSRAYILRKNRIVQVTEDHTYVNSLVRAGVITKKQAETHEEKNAITRAIGADINVIADYFAMDMREGDIVLLCSDGLSGEVSDEEIKNIINESESMKEAAEVLLDRANEKGGRDNISIICIKPLKEEL